MRPQPDLDIGRINRFLRPLRNRCAALASLAATPHPSTSSTCPVTYSTHSSVGSNTPPLSILPHPDTLRVRVHFEKTGPEMLELSRKIYAVRDSFKDVVLKVQASSDSLLGSQQSDHRQSATTLSAICATIVGMNIPNESITTIDSTQVLPDLSDELYEAVPLPYRGWTVLSHALNLILETCQHHPTLLSVLLDVALSHDLPREAHVLLHELLSVATYPRPGSQTSPPLCHPSHSTFLSELRDRWSSSGRQDSDFLRILLDVLEDNTNVEVWTSRAMHNIMRNNNMNFSYFMFFTAHLYEIFLVVRKKASSRGTHHKEVEQVDFSTVNRRLNKWLCLSHDRCCSLDPTLHVSESVYYFLARIWFNSFASDDAMSTADIDNSIVQLGTAWLASFSSHSSPSQVTTVVNTLHTITPQTSTYSTYVRSLYHNHELAECRQHFNKSADLLRSKGLLRLEACLWASALRHAEDPTNEYLFSGQLDDLKRHRRELIDLVDQAESRCFGTGTVPAQSCHIVDFYTKIIDQTPEAKDRTTRLACEWEWEPVIGCWIRKADCPTSARKKPRIDLHGLLPRVFGRAVNDRRSRHSAPLAKAMQCPSPIRTIQSPLLRRYSTSGGFKQCTSERREEDVAARRRLSGFSSLLTNALSNRTSVHANASQETPRRVPPHSTWHTDSARQAALPFMDSPQTPWASHVPSDDILDLFAYDRSSSPIRPR
ncbi:hypothetical protein BDQ12DRAFT_673222 [Crucibulum laeve]|uniref:Uncharacterized protein n=1 Tax=Crucibulum laeve TaxID=68775 RepID=A0A5C3MI11_9AGAR|nr:hypothetical protein BDQ12DRAFT_673222 [Crucibulum laeve]